MKIIAAIALIYSSVSLLFIFALCKAAARRMPTPPGKDGAGREIQQPDRRITVSKFRWNDVCLSEHSSARRSRGIAMRSSTVSPGKLNIYFEDSHWNATVTGESPLTDQCKGRRFNRPSVNSNASSQRETKFIRADFSWDESPPNPFLSLATR
jgi:hypothetical protein